MGKIFVSYARDESKKVYKILDRLRKHDIDFWVDTIDIENGKDWTEEISKAIVNCKKFFLLMSRLSMASLHTAQEIKIASVGKKGFVILRLDDVKYPTKLKYALEGTQWTDHWHGDWETKITKALGGTFQPTTSIRLLNEPKTVIIASKKKQIKSSSPENAINELKSMFSGGGRYYKDQCDSALYKLNELRKVIGTHWINPPFAYRYLMPRVIFLEKIDALQELILGFQTTCPPGDPMQRMGILGFLEQLGSDLNSNK
jgi:hypothetical protein